MNRDDLPLAGIKVIEFTHMVMGPAVGVILADMGATVVKVEPIGGDQTRHLRGSGAGYYPMFNRNKNSICLDLKSAEGLEVAKKLVDSADVVIENFRPGTLAKLGLGYEALSASNPGLIYCSAKGFLSGPYEKRTALDEVTQMMGGLAYMTGPPGRPLRAGASVVDITGGMFGAIGVLGALQQRHRTGKGAQITCSLYETTAFLVGQHMAQQAVTGQEAKPMPVRLAAWAVYDVFETANEGEQLFVGVVSDSQWKTFCQAFGLDELLNNPELETNNQRTGKRDVIIPVVREMFQTKTRAELVEKLETIGLPFAPIAKPAELFDDPHLNAGGLLPITMPNNGEKTKLPALPIEYEGERFGVFHDVPTVGEDTDQILADIGFDAASIARLKDAKAVG
ncbi:MAG TPA: CaiB/BaiF CoA-transferase family protein [Pedomonas sp.]|uniref:CaiB/BaiF CoA transferase family protein n=1 Tax=Pedomonas sp. TaxID=2976421 RepID=UPI002F408063